MKEKKIVMTNMKYLTLIILLLSISSCAMQRMKTCREMCNQGMSKYGDEPVYCECDTRNERKPSQWE